MTPIRQQNPPGPLKLLSLREKTGKNTDFLILLKTPVFLVYATAPVCRDFGTQMEFQLGLAQPDLANGAQFQVQIKEILVRISNIYIY